MTEIIQQQNSEQIRFSNSYRDVWLIELTGGPGTECDSCPDYTYEDLTDKYWPALVGGVLKLTSKVQATYVGHSNGGRVALDAMSKWQGSGKSSVGTLSDGTTFNLPANAIDTYIGVGVPGQLDDTNLNPLLYSLKYIGNDAIIQLQVQGINHPSRSDLISKGVQDRATVSGSTNKGISLNLLRKYFQLINSTLDDSPGIGLSLDKTLMIAGTLLVTNDEIVPVNDVDTIYSNIGVNSGGKKILMHIWDGHIGMTTTLKIKTVIKQFINDDPLSGNVIDEVKG